MPEHNRAHSGTRQERRRFSAEVTALTLTRSVGALEVRGQSLVASQLPPATHVVVVGPADADDMVTVQTVEGVEYVVFASDLVESQPMGS